MYAIGGNPEAARLSGVRVVPLRILGFVIVGVSAAVAAILITSVAGVVLAERRHVVPPARVRRGVPRLRGASGRASSTSPGRWSASCSSASSRPGLTMLDLETYVINLVQGGILIAAVLISRLGERSAAS